MRDNILLIVFLAVLTGCVGALGGVTVAQQNYILEMAEIQSELTEKSEIASEEIQLNSGGILELAGIFENWEKKNI